MGKNGVYCLSFGVYGLWFIVWGLSQRHRGYGVVLGFGVYGLSFGVWGLEFRQAQLDREIEISHCVRNDGEIVSNLTMTKKSRLK